MWRFQKDLFELPSYSPTLYPFGDDIEAWANAALDPVKEKNLIIIGNSIGGSCALEIAVKVFRRRTVKDLLDGTTAFHTRPNRKHLLRELRCEVTFVSGADDIAPDTRINREEAKAVMHGTCHVIPDCGRYVPLEAPRAFNGILLKSLTPVLRSCNFQNLANKRQINS